MTRVPGTALGLLMPLLWVLNLLAIRAGMPIPLTLGLGVCIAYLAFTPVHEAAHDNLLPRWNGLLGQVNSTVLFGAFLPYRALHRAHHRAPNVVGEDPDLWGARGPHWSLPLRWATADLGYLRAWFATPRPWAGHGELVLRALFFAVVLATTATWGLWTELLFAWLLPARIAQTLLAFAFAWLPHAPHTPGDRFHTTTVDSTPVLTWLLVGQNFHGLHHLDPRIPFHRLAPTWARQERTLRRLGLRDRAVERRHGMGQLGEHPPDPG